MADPIPLRPSSLHEEVSTRLRNMIFERQLAPGQWIDELALAREWQISRTPLREALKVLAAEGLVVPVPRQGCKVAEMSEDEADELLPIMEACYAATNPVAVKTFVRLLGFPVGHCKRPMRDVSPEIQVQEARAPLKPGTPIAPTDRPNHREPIGPYSPTLERWRNDG